MHSNVSSLTLQCERNHSNVSFSFLFLMRTRQNVSYSTLQCERNHSNVFSPNANKTERFLSIVAVRTRQNVTSLTLQRGFEARTKHSSETTNRRRAFHGKDNTELSLSLSLYSSPLGVVEWQFVFAIICPPFIDSFKL